MTDQLFKQLEDKTRLLIDEVDRLRENNKHLRVENAKLKAWQTQVKEQLNGLLSQNP